MMSLPQDLTGVRAGGKAALARILTAMETSPDDPGLSAILDEAHGAPRGFVLGLTGPPGVGKSTLANALLAEIRAGGRSMGIIAIDPSSRRSGGALLGDRTRIETDPADAGVFLRSMAARNRLGGLSDLTFPAMVLMRALFDWVLIETVGVGQSETDIAGQADLVVFCAQPGSGDALQFMKAGVTEVPDIVLVTKGDLGKLAGQAAADLRGALSLSVEAREVAIAVVSSRTGEGISEAVALIEARAAALQSQGQLARRRAEQLRFWTAARLIESFGSEGIAVLGSEVARADRPFASNAALHARLRVALRRAFQSA